MISKPNALSAGPLAGFDASSLVNSITGIFGGDPQATSAPGGSTGVNNLLTTAAQLIPGLRPQPATVPVPMPISYPQPAPVPVRPPGMTTTQQQVTAKSNALLYATLGVGALVVLGGVFFLTRK